MTSLGILGTLALMEIPGVGSRTVSKIASLASEHIQSERDLDRIIQHARSHGVRVSTETQSTLSAAIDLARTTIDKCDELDIHIVCIGSPGYPSYMSRLTDPPVLLFIRGTLGPINTPIAVVGTRHPTDWGQNACARATTALAELGAEIVSGLALGIDTIAHTTAVQSGTRTLAVLPQGVETVSPASNKSLAEQIVAEGGALVSELKPGTAPNKSHFIRRNRIQVGLSRAVFVIESSNDGGTMKTADFATKSSVPIWVTLPESAKSELIEQHKGTWELYQNGASWLRTREDIARAYASLFEDRDIATEPADSPPQGTLF